MAHYEYQPHKVCARQIEFDLDGDVVTNVHFVKGCDGNLKAISKLIDGMTVSQIESKLAGNDCKGRGTSCADQLVQGLKEAYKVEQTK